MRTTFTYKPINNLYFKQQLLHWSEQFREVIFLDSNELSNKYSNYNCVLAVDAFTSIVTDYSNAFEDLDIYQKTAKDWLFGYLSYDLKNDIEDLSSTNYDGLDFPDLFFFQPKKIFLQKGEEWEVLYLGVCDDEWELDLKDIINQEVKSNFEINNLNIEHRIPEAKYLEKVSQMQEEIQKGNIYEANFCMEFFAKNAQINPLQTFQKLNSISRAPFSTFLKIKSNYLLCASPERFLTRKESTIVSQPIKGTAKRVSDLLEDEALKLSLENDPKERSENIMIVDLVRNDLSKTAEKNSVQVEELCKIYTFPQVHQMISTVKSTVKSEISSVKVIQECFPMGSMTGAPKISAMQIIERLEETKRGLYSGAVGYFDPENNFDFNVVIRSILYNEMNKYVSFSVGSAITHLSDPKMEYQECLLKAKAMQTVLKS